MNNGIRHLSKTKPRGLCLWTTSYYYGDKWSIQEIDTWLFLTSSTLRNMSKNNFFLLIQPRGDGNYDLTINHTRKENKTIIMIVCQKNHVSSIRSYLNSGLADYRKVTFLNLRKSYTLFQLIRTLHFSLSQSLPSFPSKKTIKYYYQEP